MEYLWIFLLILFVVLFIIFLVWAWHNNNVDGDSNNVQLNCNKVIKVINTDVDNYDVYVTVNKQTVSQSSLPHMGETTICKADKIDIMATNNTNNTLHIKDVDGDESNFLILSQSHSFFTNNLNEGKPAKLYIQNESADNIVAVIKVNKSMWTVNVEAGQIVQAESKYYHELYNHNQPCLIEVYGYRPKPANLANDSSAKVVQGMLSKYHATKNDLEGKNLVITADGQVKLV